MIITDRKKLLRSRHYSPGCFKCQSKTEWDSKVSQFVCQCGWRSQFPGDFIRRYKKQWGYE